MLDIRQELIAALQEGPIAALRAEGFAPRFIASRDSTEIRTAFPLGVLTREADGQLQLIELQFDKRGKAKFVVNVGVVPRDGVDLPWAKIPRDSVMVSDLPLSFRLYRGPRFLQWFSAHGLFGSHESGVRRAVDELSAKLPQVLEWLSSGAIGPNMRRFGFPVGGPALKG